MLIVKRCTEEVYKTEKSVTKHFGDCGQVLDVGVQEGSLSILVIMNMHVAEVYKSSKSVTQRSGDYAQLCERGCRKG